MSFNKLKYDTCAYKKDLDQSVGPLSYILNPIKYENCNKCRHEFGLVGGSAVSHIRGNLVDLENDLRNQTRPASSCPSKKFQPISGNKINIEASQCSSARSIDITPMHLSPCQMIRYPAIPLPPAPKIESCPAPRMQAPKPKCN